MDTRTFLQRVLPTKDKIVIAALRQKEGAKPVFWNYANCDSIDEAVNAIQEINNDPHLTAYFAVGTHKDNEELKEDGKKKILRKQSTASWFKTLCLDLDIGKDKGSPYETQKEGALALITALRDLDLPPPMLVSSGKGLHCYWPLTTEVPTNEWERLSRGLRAALRSANVVIDESKIHDPSMVLRPVGSYYKKETPWRTVDVIADCDVYGVSEIKSKLEKWCSAPIPTKPKRIMSDIAAAILKSGYEPLNISTIIKECPQLAAMAKSGGATDAMGRVVSEPLWRGVLGVAAYTTNPQEAINLLCSKYPNFNLEENLHKLEAWHGTGVTTCAYFEQHCPEGCASCTHRGSINSVAALNRLTTLTIDKFANSDDNEDGQIELKLPDGYFVSNNKVWKEVEVEKQVKDENGKKQVITATERQLVSKYPIVVLDLYQGDNFERTTIRWATKFPVGGWMSFEMPAETLMAGGAELAKYLGNKQIFMHEDALLQRTRSYMISYADFIKQTRPTGLDLRSFGWQADGSFLAGDRLLSLHKTGVAWRPVKTLQKLMGKIGVAGDRQVWVDMTKMLNDESAHHVAFSTLVAGCGLLLPATGIPSFVYSLWSTQTGTGKTISLLWGTSLFGHPTKNLLTPSDTSNALYQVMGTLGSYSACMDEITNMGADRAASFAFDAQAGREKISLSANRELREGAEWHAPLRVTTNTSLFYLYDLYKNANDAEKVRTLEVQVDCKAFVEKYNMEDMVAELCRNYGHAAPEIAYEIMQRGGKDKVYNYYRNEFEKVFSDFTFESEERFYRAGIICSWAIGRIGVDLGLFKFDVEACTRWVLNRVLQLRKLRSTSKIDAFDVIGQFLSDYNDQIVVIKEENGNKPVAQMPIPNTAAARIELVLNGGQLQPGSKLIINIARLREWAKKYREDINNVIYLLSVNNAVISERERVTMYKGTHNVNPGQAHCLVLNLTHKRFADVIASSRSILPTNPALAVLQGGKGGL